MAVIPGGEKSDEKKKCIKNKLAETAAAVVLIAACAVLGTGTVFAVRQLTNMKMSILTECSILHSVF